jgi:Ca-activated chloride channel homolog
MEFLGIYWANIDYIIFLPVVLIFMFFCLKNFYRVKVISLLLADSKNFKLLFKNFSIGKYRIKTILTLVSLFFLFVALLQPQWDKKEQTVVQEGRDLLIVLDISRSMMAEDFKPTRLDFAKLKIRSLLSKLTCDRVGLVLFSGSAFLQCPLTADHSAFLMFLNQVDVETISSGTTAIDNALKKATEIFANNMGRKNKLVLLLTDGEDFSLNLEHVKNNANEQEIKLFSIGVGTTQGAPIPIFDQTGKQIGLEKDKSGSIELSKLNEKALQDLCNKLSGTYLSASHDDSDLEQIASIIKSFEKEKLMDKKLSLYEDKYPWFLGIAWVLLILEWLL